MSELFSALGLLLAGSAGIWVMTLYLKYTDNQKKVIKAEIKEKQKEVEIEASKMSDSDLDAAVTKLTSDS